MAKNNKCEVCGAKINSGQLRCTNCGIPLVNLKKKIKDNITGADEIKTTASKSRPLFNDRPFNDRVLIIIKRLGLLANYVNVISFFGLIFGFIYLLVVRKFLIAALCIPLFFLLPYFSLPVLWMQAMLENVYMINVKTK